MIIGRDELQVKPCGMILRLSKLTCKGCCNIGYNHVAGGPGSGIQKYTALPVSWKSLAVTIVPTLEYRMSGIISAVSMLSLKAGTKIMVFLVSFIITENLQKSSRNGCCFFSSSKSLASASNQVKPNLHPQPKM